MELTKRLRLLFAIALIEYLLYFFSGVSFASLHGSSFYNLEADPAFWAFYLAKIPQFIVAHQWLGVVLDICILFLFFLVIRNPLENKVAILLFLLLLLYYVTLMGYLTHRNYQLGIFMVFVPFMFKKKMNRAMAFESVRYFILFFYFSAALLKILNNSAINPEHFGHFLTNQFTPYYLEGNTGIRTSVNLYLIGHTSIAYALYIGTIIIEGIAIIGFFTKKYDGWLAILFLVFHVGNWFIMDIGVIGQVSFISLLFLTRSLSLTKEMPVPVTSKQVQR